VRLTRPSFDLDTFVPFYAQTVSSTNPTDIFASFVTP
jgi:hypothetical protein